jgi:ABC-type polysaccharide/polyol phosphate transport system ATPase subunit
MSEPAIEVRDVSKSFRTVHQASSIKRAALEWWRSRKRVDQHLALEGLSFSVPAGQTLGVVGANGSGKSTLLALLAGIYRPSAGEIVLRGRVVTLLDLFAGMHPDLTAEDNAVLLAMVYGLTRREAVAALPAIMAYAELTAHADEVIRHFSAGMVVRLGFSTIVHTQPDILLVDEVLAVGDQAFQTRCHETVARFQEAGKTIVFVSHDLETIGKVCERVLWIDRARLRLDGPAADVIAAYRSALAVE